MLRVAARPTENFPKYLEQNQHSHLKRCESRPLSLLAAASPQEETELRHRSVSSLEMSQSSNGLRSEAPSAARRTASRSSPHSLKKQHRTEEKHRRDKKKRKTLSFLLQERKKKNPTM